MKVRLLHPDQDPQPAQTLPSQLCHLVEADLELDVVYSAMAAGDAYLRDVVRKVLLDCLTEPYLIEYRQSVLADCVANEAVVRRMYAISVDAMQTQRKIFLGGLLTKDPSAILRRGVRMLELLHDNLRELRDAHDLHAVAFTSEGFRQFWAMISDQLSDDYLTAVHDELTEMALPRGTLLSAQIGLGNKGRDYRLHRAAHHHWWERLTGADHPGLGFTINERDQAGTQALTELAGRAVNDAANTVSQAVDHVQGFFAELRRELGFYLGCLNLQHALDRHGVATCYPTPMPLRPRRFHCEQLRDVALCLSTTARVVGNDVDARDVELLTVTGANEGGKSTFLRSRGSSQLMMQAGMFVAAESFTASVTNGVYTHFKREEDSSMTHGKLDEELARMSEIADSITAGCLLLCNESFASTTEREGSQIARGVIDALTAADVTVVFVTHLFDLAHSLYRRDNPRYLFLRAERRDDSSRTYRLAPAAPLATSHGLDSFARVFGQPVRATTG